MLSLCTVFSDYFYATITKLKILGYYCLNGGLYHMVHAIVELCARGVVMPGCWRLGGMIHGLIFKTRVHVLTPHPQANIYNTSYVLQRLRKSHNGSGLV